MRVVFFGTPEFAVPSLAALHGSRHQIVAVVTRPDRPAGRGRWSRQSAVKREALRLGLPVLEPARPDEELVARLRPLAPAALAVVAYGRILPPALLALAPLGAINLHGSLLPRHRGASPVQAAILAGDAETGVTTMLLDEGLDTGPMLLRAATPIGPEETAGELAHRLAALGAPLLVATFDAVEAGTVTPEPQDPARATTCPKIAAGDARIDWSLPAELIARRVRAYSPEPGCFTTLPSARRLGIERAAPLEGEAGEAPPGTVLVAGPRAVVVACGRGQLALLAARPEGRRTLGPADLVNGRHLRAGDRLGA